MTKAQKVTFFERGARATERIYDSLPKDIYPCPLCGRMFTRDDLQNGDLTLEHVPPKALGGRVLCLTCRACNNQAGADSDSHAVARMASVLDAQTIAGTIDREIRAQLTIDSINANVTIRSKGGQIHVDVPAHINPPNTSKQLSAKFNQMAADGTWDGQRFSIRPRTRYRLHAAKVADLRSAYLAAFAQYGYRYAFHPALDVVREQIAEPQSEIISDFWSAWEAVEGHPMVLKAHQPTDCIVGFFARSLVFLPWPSAASPDDLYQWLAEHLQQGQTIKIDGSSCFWPERMMLTLDFMPDPDERP